MSEPKSPDTRNTRNPVTARQQLRALLDELLDGQDSPETSGLTGKPRALLEELRVNLGKSRVDEADAKRLLERQSGRNAEPESEQGSNRRRYSASKVWKNLCDALAEDVLKEGPPEITDAEVERIREELKSAMAGSHIARIEKRVAREQQRKKNKYLN